MRRALGAVALAFLAAAAAEASDLRVADLRCEYAVDPLGVDTVPPRLSWRVVSAERGQRQTAWRILVASAPERMARDEGDLWDSGRVEGSQTVAVRYGGAPLHSSQAVFWKAQAWDAHGRPTSWSPPASWTMGLLAPADWSARWIVAPWTSESLLLRREVAVRPGLRRALLHVSGLGQYEAAVNGARITDDLLTPGWTDYGKTVLYDTRDVTALLRPGANAIGVTLGNGMYHVVRRDRFAKFTRSFGPLRLIAQLQLDYADGTSETIGTDERWRVSPGPITYNSIYGGEDYDARLRPEGWDRPGFDESAWSNAVLLVRPTGTLRGQGRAAPPIRAIEARAPAAVRELPSGATLYDFGQNASFMPRLRVSGPRGSTVRLTPGEVVNDDGSIDRGTMGGAERGSAWWQYTKATDGEETWRPQFYYVGSRYLHVERRPAGDGAMPRVESLEAVLIHSTAAPVGRFAASDPRLGRIRELVRWAQRSNMVSILTDCPHREKLGWIEQLHLNGPSVRYEFDTTRLFAKAARDMADAQSDEGLVPNIAPEYADFKGAFRSAAEWGAAFLLVPWQQYLFTGDDELLRAQYDGMKRYFAFLETQAVDDVLAAGLGDWHDFEIGTAGRAGLTPPAVTASAFFVEDARVLARTAALLGLKEDEQRYTARAETLRRRYVREHHHAETGTYGSGSQSSLALPLALDLAAPEHRPALLTALVHDVEARGYATAGDVGFRFLLRALADAGRNDLVYRLVTQDEKPGYGYQLKQGATSLAEAWDANRKVSHNHLMLGHVIEWLYADLAGIRPAPEAPGFARVVIRPSPVADLQWVEAAYESIRGPIDVRWERAGDRFTLIVGIPANVTAEVHVPSRDGVVREGGEAAARARGVTFRRRDVDRSVFAVDSGHYRFESRWTP